MNWTTALLCKTDDITNALWPAWAGLLQHGKHLSVKAGVLRSALFCLIKETRLHLLLARPLALARLRIFGPECYIPGGLPDWLLGLLGQAGGRCRSCMLPLSCT